MPAWSRRAAASAVAACGAALAWLGGRRTRLERLVHPVLRRWAAVPPSWRAVLFALAVPLLWRLSAAQVIGAVETEQDTGAIVLVSGLQTMPALLAWRLPLLALAPILLGTAIGAATWPVWPLAGMVSLGITLYAVGVRTDRRVALAAGVLAVVSVLPAAGNSYSGMGPLIPPLIAGLSATVLVAADNARSRRLAEDALARRQADYEREQARRAVLEERSRIARELHDVVAHHMSMIAVQAETAPYRIDGLPEEGVRDYAAISATARGALTEMRRLLGVLRSEGDQGGTTPQPGLDQLGGLVDGARSAGMPVRLTVHGTPAPVPAAVELSAFRIVQEALSNAGRHAPGAAVAVDVAYTPEGLEVTVDDDGRGTRPRATGTGAGAGPSAARHGLLGMSERVTMLGGVLAAGPTPEGGFRVHALLPLEPAAESPPAPAAEPAGEGGGP